MKIVRALALGVTAAVVLTGCSNNTNNDTSGGGDGVGGDGVEVVETPSELAASCEKLGELVMSVDVTDEEIMGVFSEVGADPAWSDENAAIFDEIVWGYEHYINNGDLYQGAEPVEVDPEVEARAIAAFSYAAAIEGFVEGGCVGVIPDAPPVDVDSIVPPEDDPAGQYETSLYETGQ